MEPTTLVDARAILGEDVLDLDVSREFLHIRIPPSWRARLRTVPFERQILERCRSTHLLFAGTPLSILDLRRRALHCFGRPFWYARDPFAKDEEVEPRWYLLRKDVVPGSMGKAFTEQLALLDETEVVPRACEVVYGVVLYFLARNRRLFPDMSARCRDTAHSNIIASGARVDVGNFTEGGLGIALWDDKPDEGMGLASMVTPMEYGKERPLQR